MNRPAHDWPEMRVASDGAGPILENAEGRIMASVSPWLWTDGGHSLAHLLAAAPKMLQALEVMIEAASATLDPEHCMHGRVDWQALRHQARVAVAQARRQPVKAS